MSRGKSTAVVIKDYAGQLSEIYCALLFILLPLYIPEGYTDLGLHKYKLYFAITFVYLIFALPLSIAGFILENREHALYGGVIDGKRQKGGKTRDDLAGKVFAAGGLNGISLPVIFAILYLVSCAISFIISINKHSSLYGYGGWNMGFTTQLVMAAGFLVAVYAAPRFNRVILFGFIGSAITYVIAILNRFYVYPIKVGMTTSEFISTLGQTNWFCGYMTIFVSLAIGLFVASGREMFKDKAEIGVLLYLILSFVCMWIQGSDSIFFAMGIVLFVVFLVALGSRESFMRFSIVLGIMGIAAELDYLLIYALFKDHFFFLQDKDIGNNLIRHHVGLLLLLFSVVGLVICMLKKNGSWNLKVVTAVRAISVLLFVGAVIAMVTLIYLVTTKKEAMGALFDIRFFRFNNKWGTGRGEIWKICVKSYGLLPFIRKIFGVGISCYYEYIYTPEKFGKVLEASRGLIVTNAHNMVLNLLIETGLMGVVAYLGFYVSAIVMMFRRALNNFRRVDVYALAVLACVCGHFANSIFSFQQITATPMILVVLGAYLGLVRNELLL